MQPKKYLIVCTFRTGSTVLADLLEHSTGYANLGECLVTSSLSGRPNLVQTNNRLVYEFRENLIRYAGSGSSTDLIKMVEEQERRIQIVKQQSNWIIKNPIIQILYNKQFIEYCCEDPDTQVIFLYRKNIVEQFKSEINNAFRNVLRGRPQNNFTANSEVIDYDSINYTDSQMKGAVTATIQRLEIFKLLHQLYGDKGILISYEDNIKPLNLQCLGISNSTIQDYRKNSNSLIPTPFNTTNLKEGSWETYINILQKVKYLTEFPNV